MFETMTPMLRLLPPARLRAWRFGLYLSSSTAFRTRARVVFLTRPALLRTRETVAVEPGRVAQPDPASWRCPDRAHAAHSAATARMVAAV